MNLAIIKRKSTWVFSSIIILSMLFSIEIYWHNSTSLEKKLTSEEWYSEVVTRFKDHSDNEIMSSFNKIKTTSSIKYFTNGSYQRETRMQLFTEESDETSNMIRFLETGTWQINDNYLQISLNDLDKAVVNKDSKLDTDQLNLIRKIFSFDMQQSRKIESVNEQTLLLTDLNNVSTLLFKN